jgi:hypothetical protein
VKELPSKKWVSKHIYSLCALEPLCPAQHNGQQMQRSLATAVLNKNNRNKLGQPSSSSYFPLIMAYIYIYKIDDFKKTPPRAPLLCRLAPHLNFINI